MNVENDEIESAEGFVSPRILVASFLEHLFQFLRQTEIHDASNQIFERCLDSLIRSFKALQRLPEFVEVAVSFRGEQIYLNQTRMRPKARQFRQQRFLLRFMRTRRIGGFSFPSQIDREQLLKFLWIAAEIDGNSEDGLSQAIERLKSMGLENYRIDPMQGFHSVGAADSKLVDLELMGLMFHEKLRKFAEKNFENLEHSSQFEHVDAAALIRDLTNLPEDDLLQVFRTSMMKRVERPYAHMAADSCLAMAAWGRSMGLPAGILIEVAGAALAHPLIYVMRQKLSIDPINDKESLHLFGLMQKLKSTWPLSDLQRLSLLEWTMPYGVGGVYEWSGVKCYAHFFSRMLSIVAHFKFLTQNFPGKPVYLPDEAMAELLTKENFFDPTLLKLFVNWMGIYPVGSFVLLRSGELAQVFAAGSDPLKFKRPLVNILRDADGKLLRRPVLVDLSEMNEKLGIYKKSILKSLSAEQANIPEEMLGLLSVNR